MFTDPITQASFVWMKKLQNSGFSPAQAMAHVQKKMREAPIVGLSERDNGPERNAVFVDPKSESVELIVINVSRKAVQALLGAEKIEDIWLPDGTVIFCDENGKLGDGEYHAAKFKRGQVLGPFLILGPLDEGNGLAADALQTDVFIRSSILQWVHREQKPEVMPSEFGSSPEAVGAYSHVWIDGKQYKSLISEKHAVRLE